MKMTPNKRERMMPGMQGPLPDYRDRLLCETDRDLKRIIGLAKLMVSALHASKNVLDPTYSTVTDRHTAFRLCEEALQKVEEWNEDR